LNFVAGSDSSEHIPYKA